MHPRRASSATSLSVPSVLFLRDIVASVFRVVCVFFPLIAMRFSSRALAQLPSSKTARAPHAISEQNYGFVNVWRGAVVQCSFFFIHSVFFSPSLRRSSFYGSRCCCCCLFLSMLCCCKQQCAVDEAMEQCTTAPVTFGGSCRLYVFMLASSTRCPSGTQALAHRVRVVYVCCVAYCTMASHQAHRSAPASAHTSALRN